MNNNYILNRFFSKETILETISGKDRSAFFACAERFISSTDEDLTNYDIIRKLYCYLSHRYRNEYYYKNTLLNKLLLGTHSLNTTTALVEIPVGDSKADFILINGKAIVYEIKTELDTLDRLESQIADYYKAFKSVCIFTTQSNFQRLISTDKYKNVGIYVLTDSNTISKKLKREPTEDLSMLNHKYMFKILRKKEFESIIISIFGSLPITDRISHYEECYKLFCAIDIEQAYRCFISQLRSRKNIDIVRYTANVPYELRQIVYMSEFKKRDYEMLNCFLSEKYGG